MQRQFLFNLWHLPLLAAFVQILLGSLARVCTSSQRSKDQSQVSTTITYAFLAFIAFIAFMAFFGAAAAAFAAFLAILLNTGEVGAKAGNAEVTQD